MRSSQASSQLRQAFTSNDHSSRHHSSAASRIKANNVESASNSFLVKAPKSPKRLSVSARGQSWGGGHSTVGSLLSWGGAHAMSPSEIYYRRNRGEGTAIERYPTRDQNFAQNTYSNATAGRCVDHDADQSYHYESLKSQCGDHRRTHHALKQDDVDGRSYRDPRQQFSTSAISDHKRAYYATYSANTDRCVDHELYCSDRHGDINRTNRQVDIDIMNNSSRVNSKREAEHAGSNNALRIDERYHQSRFGSIGKFSSNSFASDSRQNCGNVISDRPSSRILAPPGGHSTICIG